jgi:hypothetical protein
LKITYNLIVSWPRIEWYILLASVSGVSIRIDTVSKSVLRMSAFWEGGRGNLEFVMAFVNSRQRAKEKRIGCTVNVYKNESKQRIKPKDTIFRMVRGHRN